ncbi:short chain dehydrogenase [Mesorhizobium albiziae]|uniref:Short chain dehydrogenase n=2 Tax=Neomesorhizobium albiziae TaxID=335020 RepID=A0A1I4FA35_9HYPH|nr:short chain dehydrogenase [Mesorhizobium albiziae]
MSAVRLSREVAKRMKDEGIKGDILLISSAGIHEEPGHLLLSGAMRAGIAVLAKHMSHVLAGTGIRVNVVALGYFDTGRVHDRIETLVADNGLDRPVAIERVAGANPMKRVGRAEEVAELVAFMVGDRAEFLNGTTIVIDGGSNCLVT